MSTSRVRVVFLVSTLRRTGPTSQLLNIVRHLDSRKFEPVVVTLSPEPALSMLDSFNGTGATIKSLSMSRMQAIARRDWRREIERALGSRLDGRSVIHSQGVRSDVISARYLDGVARVATARNYPYDDYVMKFGRLLGGWMARSHLRAFRLLPVVVACSSTVSDQLRKHGIGTTVIRNGVDISKFEAARPDECARLRSELGLDVKARVGVCVGALSARKNPLSIVQAVRAIVDPALTILFLGTGSLEASCRRESLGDERIRFVGHVTDVARYLRAADFFISASLSEGFPNAALEAIACGLYCVLSDIVPHRELLALAPSAGELFATGDPAALMAAIERAAMRTPGLAGLAPESVAEVIGAQGMSLRYQELYLRLTREAAGS